MVNDFRKGRGSMYVCIRMLKMSSSYDSMTEFTSLFATDVTISFMELSREVCKREDAVNF